MPTHPASPAAHRPLTRRLLSSTLLALACAPPSARAAPAAQQGGAPARAAPAAASEPTAAPAPTACEPTPGLLLVSHDVALDVSLAPPSLSGEGSLRVKATQPVRVVALDALELSVERASVGSRAADFVQRPGLVCVELPAPLAAGDEQTLRLEWRVDTAKRLPAFSKEEAWAGYETAAWMPTLQDAAQRATLALRITTDVSSKVGASGRAVGTRSLADGRAVHSFVLDRPSPPFLYAFAVGRFDAAELHGHGARLRAFGPPGIALDGALQATGEMYRFALEKLGAPHPWGDYLQVFVRADVAQEAAGMALIGAEALRDREADPEDDWVFMHELSHQWFGWMVPCADFSDFWLNEGFATFLVGAFKQARWGAAAYERELQRWRERSARARKEGGDGPLALSSPTGASRPSPGESELQARGVTYFRGALVLHRLRVELGEAAFWRGVRTYVATMAGKSARSSDLRHALEAASGRDLSGFFERWVYTLAGEP